MGDRLQKEILELFVQNLLVQIRKKDPSYEGLIATISVDKLSSKWAKQNSKNHSRMDTLKLAKGLESQIITSLFP